MEAIKKNNSTKIIKKPISQMQRERADKKQDIKWKAFKT